MQGKIKYSYLLLITTYLLLTVGMSFSYGQQKRSKFSFQDKVRKVRKEDRMQAEYLFTEGVKNAILEDYPKAISYLRRSLELDPSNSAAYYKMAELLFKTGQLAEAEQSINTALQLEDKIKYYYLLAADIQAQLAQFDKAAAIYESMLTHTDAGPQHLLELAMLYLHMHDYTKAIATFDQAEQSLGVNEQIVLQKQKLYLQQNKLQEAINEGEKLVEHFPNEPAYVVKQAELLINNQRYEEAMTYLENYLKDYPEQAQAQYLLGKVHQQQGNTVAANKHLKEAFQSTNLNIELKVQEIAALLQQLPDPRLQASLDSLTTSIIEAHPEQAKAFVIRGDYLFAVEKKQEARLQYLKALELDKSNFEVWQNALSIGLELGRFDSVAEEADEALEMFPNQAAIYYFSGAAHMSLKNYDEAVFALEQGKKLAGSNVGMKSIFNGQLGDVYNSLEQFEKSDAAYEAALRDNPNNEYILNNYSYYLSLRGEKLDQALEMSEKLVKKHPDNPTYLDTHAWVLYQLKEYKEAKKYLERALAQEGVQDGTIVEHYGDVLFKLNQQEEALKQWKKAQTLTNTSDLLEKKINDQKLYE